MKILLFGKNGQVGFELQRSLAPLGELVALGTDSTELCGDFRNLDGLRQAVRKVAPHIIVNAAAYTAVDKAESEQGLAHLINAEAPGLLAEEAKKADSLLVHYSTDYVFDGSGSDSWQETDIPAPLNVYGVSKLAGEKAIEASACRHLIMRTSWVYAARGTNFIKTMLRLGKERDALSIVSDQIGAPTGAELLANLTAHALKIGKSRKDISGVFHVAAQGETSWYRYAEFIFDCARKAKYDLKITSLTPKLSRDYPTPAKRPLNSRLKTTKFENTFALHLPPWQDGVASVISEMASGTD